VILGIVVLCSSTEFRTRITIQIYFCLYNQPFSCHRSLMNNTYYNIIFGVICFGKTRLDGFPRKRVARFIENYAPQSHLYIIYRLLLHLQYNNNMSYPCRNSVILYGTRKYWKIRGKSQLNNRVRLYEDF